MADLKLDDEIAEVTGLGNTAVGWATKVQNLLNAALKSNLNPFGTAATKDVADISGGSSEQGKIPVLDSDGRVPDIFINLPEGKIDTSNIPDRTLPAVKLVRGTLTGDEFAPKTLGHRKINASGVDSNGDPFPGRVVLGFSGGRFSFLVSQDYSIGDIKTLAYQPSPLPNGWLPCDGRSLSRIKYANLFTLLSTSYGNVDGDHFNLPDLRGRVVVNKGTTDAFSSIGKTGGNETHTLTEDEIPRHGHLVARNTTLAGAVSDDPLGDNYLAYRFARVNNTAYYLKGQSAVPNIGKTSDTGGDTAHTNLQPYIVQEYRIFAG